jgi:hypothetical protein
VSEVQPAQRPLVNWWLILLGVAVIAGGVLLRGHMFNGGTTTETAQGKPVKVTTSTAPPSDSLLLGILGVGAIFVLGGAFYGRISKVTLPGGTAIEFAEAQKQAAAAVERVVGKRSDRDASLDVPAQVAATAIAAAHGLEIRRLAQAEPRGVSSLANAAKVSLDVKSLTSGSQLTREMWDSLAEAALNEVTDTQV